MAEEFVETVEQLKEARTIEHMQIIGEYIEQIPVLRIPAQTFRNVTLLMMKEYNEKYFPEEAEKEGKKKQ